MRRPIFVAAILVLFFGGVARAQDCRAMLNSGDGFAARYHVEADAFAKAEDTYKNAAKDAACAYDAKARLANLYLCKGSATVEKSARLEWFRKGAEQAEAAIAANPNGAEGHYQYAVNLGSIVETDGVLKNLTKVRKVKKANDEALRLDPRHSLALVVEARFNADMPGLFGGSDKTAEDLFRRALAADDRNETAYIEFADFLFKRKRVTEARDYLSKVLDGGFAHRMASFWETVDRPKALDLKKRMEKSDLKSGD